MPLSMTAFADEEVQQRLLETARRSGTCLFIPHGAVVGLENIFEGRDLWEEVTMVMKKNPKNLDFSAAPQFKPAEITQADRPLRRSDARRLPAVPAQRELPCDRRAGRDRLRPHALGAGG